MKINLEKKKWQTPCMYLLDSQSVSGGSHAGAHEKNYRSSVPIGSKFLLITRTNGGFKYGVPKAHPEAYYVS